MTKIKMALAELTEAQNYLEAEKAELIALVKLNMGGDDDKSEKAQEKLVVLKVAMAKLEASVQWLLKI